jgi:hypothetical protein
VLRRRALALAVEVGAAIARWGVVRHPATGEDVYAYEVLLRAHHHHPHHHHPHHHHPQPHHHGRTQVDGFGNANFMDDANVRSLLRLYRRGWHHRGPLRPTMTHYDIPLTPLGAEPAELALPRLPAARRPDVPPHARPRPQRAQPVVRRGAPPPAVPDARSTRFIKFTASGPAWFLCVL